jgi:hypothetical protein
MSFISTCSQWLHVADSAIKTQSQENSGVQHVTQALNGTGMVYLLTDFMQMYARERERNQTDFMQMYVPQGQYQLFELHTPMNADSEQMET